MSPPSTARLRPCARLEGLDPRGRQGSLYLPALAPFPPETWPLVALLPVLDVNGALRAALEGRPAFRGAAPAVGVFACDPFLRLADMAALLRRAGVTTVVNYPTVALFEGETAAALAAVGYRAEAEFRLLLRFAELGFGVIACTASRRAVDVALGLGLRRILLHPGLVPPASPESWWAELAGHVAIEGAEPLAWDAPLQASSPRRRIRL